jgi:hypothetical protein
MYFRPATVRLESLHTTDNDVVQIAGGWGDCDDPESVERMLSATPRPSAQVITGRLPVLRSQFYLKLSGEPILVGEWSRQLNRQVHALSGGDGAVVNPSTLMRLPGSIAWPWKSGREPELTEWVTPDGGGDTFTLAALRAALPPVESEATPVGRMNGTDTAELLNPIQTLIDQARAGPLWHNPVLQLVAKLLSRGTPAAAVLAMAEHITRVGYSVQQTRDELVTMIEGARRKGFDQSDVDDVMDVPPKAAATFPILTMDQLAALPDPEWLIADLVVTDSLCTLYGPFRSYKSFVALDWALCLATGTDWCGRKAKRSDVLYIAGEGVGGLKLRVAALAATPRYCRSGPGVSDNPPRRQPDGHGRSRAPDPHRDRGTESRRVQSQVDHRRYPSPEYAGRGREQRQGHGYRRRQCRAHPTTRRLRPAPHTSRRQGRYSRSTRFLRTARSRRHHRPNNP